MSFTNPKTIACTAAPIYTAQSSTPTMVDENARPPISPAMAHITVTIANTPKTNSIMDAGSWLLINGKQNIPKM